MNPKSHVEKKIQVIGNFNINYTSFVIILQCYTMNLISISGMLTSSHLTVEKMKPRWSPDLNKKPSEMK